MSYAIVETGGKQYRAEKGSKLLVERLPGDEGTKVALRPVMFRADRQVVLEGPELEKVKVEAVIAEHLRGPKVRIFKHRPKKGYRRRAGHRQGLTRVEVTEVKLLQRKPAAPKGKAGGTQQKANKPRASAGKAATKGKSTARKSSTQRKTGTTRKRTAKKDES